MSEHANALVAILLMGTVTYATRAGGYWLMGRVTLTPRVAAMLAYLPGAVLSALVVPAVLEEGIEGGDRPRCDRAGDTVAWQPAHRDGRGRRDDLAPANGGLNRTEPTRPTFGATRERLCTMSDRQESGRSVDDAMVELSAAWDRLMQVMTSWPEDDYATLRDAAGWTALDHLAHVTAWERSRTTWLQGRSRHEGLGVSVETFTQDYDTLNEVVRQQTEGQGYDEIIVAARTTHDRLLDAIRNFDFSVADHGGITTDEARRLGGELHENLTAHYDEHRAYIEEILGSN